MNNYSFNITKLNNLKAKATLLNSENETPISDQPILVKSTTLPKALNKVVKFLTAGLGERKNLAYKILGTGKSVAGDFPRLFSIVKIPRRGNKIEVHYSLRGNGTFETNQNLLNVSTQPSKVKIHPVHVEIVK